MADKARFCQGTLIRNFPDGKDSSSTSCQANASCPLNLAFGAYDDFDELNSPFGQGCSTTTIPQNLNIYSEGLWLTLCPKCCPMKHRPGINFGS
jgi:hypothetical protein